MFYFLRQEGFELLMYKFKKNQIRLVKCKIIILLNQYLIFC